MSIFKAYDIRGIFGKDLTEETAYKIGRAFVELFKVKEVVVGKDMRDTGKILFKHLTDGITDSGADVVNIGLCSTPLFYFSCQGHESGIMITASHNPAEYNGFKMVKKDAYPIAGDTGIYELQKLVETEKFRKSETKGIIKEENHMQKFIDFNLKFAKFKKKFKIILDTGNGMGGLVFPKVFDKLNIEYMHLFQELDGRFPNHEANPLKYETLVELQKKVKKEKADLGIAIDGDADRCAFIDENADIIPNDFTTALIAGMELEKYPGSGITVDLRTSWGAQEYIKEKGGMIHLTKVGHSNIKKNMREDNSVFAGELSGHYFYKDTNYVENSILTSILILNLLDETGKKISELVKPINRYFKSEEINSEVEDKDKVLATIKEKYSDGKVLTMDGIMVVYDDWWFSVRASNTEPVIRLVVEAKTKELMEEKLDGILKLIRG